MNRDIRKITDGAMMAAIIGAVLLIDRQMAGLISGYVLFLFPLPMVFYAAKYGFKDSLMVLAAIFFLSFILSTPQTMFFVCSEAIIGLVYGSGVHRGDDNKRIVFRTLVMGALVEILAMIVFASFFGYDLTSEMAEYQVMMTEILSAAGEMPAGFDPTSYVRSVFMIAVILTGVLEGAVTHIVSRMMLKRLRIKMPPSTPFSEYVPKKWTGYAALLGLVAYYYTVYHPLARETVQMGIQGFGMISMLYLVMFGFTGIIVLGGRLYPRFAKYMVWLALFMTVTASLAVMIAGFLYITTDLRERTLKGGTEDAPKDV